MTFDGWFEGKDCDGACYIFAEAAWNAGQAAEREKYAELIAAAEAVIARWETPLWKIDTDPEFRWSFDDAEPTAEVIYRMRDALEKLDDV